MSVQIKEIAYFCHPVADIARARAFYEKLLGLRLSFELEVEPGIWWVEYDIAGVALAVSNAMPATAGGCASIALEVADLDATLASVREANVPLTIDVQDFPPCRMFGVSSPDGHSIMFHQRKP